MQDQCATTANAPNMLSPLLLSILSDTLSQADKGAYALTCKENACYVMNKNELWKNVTVLPENNSFRLHMLNHPDWTFNKVVTFGRYSNEFFEEIAKKARYVELWCPALRDIFRYLERENVYKGPKKAINIRPAHHKHYESLAEYLKETDEFTEKFYKHRIGPSGSIGDIRPDVVYQTTALLESLDVPVDFVNIPVDTKYGAQDILDSLAYPSHSRCTIINTRGWNDDPRARRVEDRYEDCLLHMTNLGLTRADCDHEFDGYDNVLVEPKSWYTDYVTEITIKAPLTWKKLFEAYLRVKSGRNDGNYEMLTKAKVRMADKEHVRIFLDFDHGS